MEKRTIYKTVRADGGTDVALVAPADGIDYECRYRLIADSGKILTDGERYARVIDTETPEAWTEIDDDGTADDDTEISAREALRIITGRDDV